MTKLSPISVEVRLHKNAVDHSTNGIRQCMNASLSYRGYIQGLRGIAVLCVVFYHVHSTILPGGYVGVDIFFVISGFLLTRVVIGDISSGYFSIAQFYYRRIVRILPTLICVCLMILVFSYFILLPPEFYNVAQSLIATLFFIPNVYFYETSDYFGPAASVLPALHFWSLGVEEQYYVCLPFIVMLTVSRSTKLLRTVLIVMFLISLLVSQILLYHSPTASFYLLPSRAFELLTGSIVASVYDYKINRHLAVNTVVGTGLVLVIFSVVFYGTETHFPGLAALLPSIGAALIIWGSESQANFVSSTLNSKALCYVGNISYSLYLVHWPIIVFSDRFLPTKYLFPRFLFLLITCGLIASMSYRFIETSFRKAEWIKNKEAGFLTSVFGSILVLVSLCMIVLHYNGFSGRLTPVVRDILAFRSTAFRSYFRSGVCFLDPEQRGVDFDTSQCMPKVAGKSAVLWGDSAAASLYSGLQEGLAEQGYSLGQLTSSACAPALGLTVAARPNCLDVNGTAIKLILDRRPDLVILSANWPPRGDLLEGLDKSVNALAAENIPVIILGSPLQYKAGVPQIIADRLLSGNASRLSGEELLLDFISKQDETTAQHFVHSKEARFLSILGTVCDKDQCPLMTRSQVPVQFDSEHLTLEGSRFIGEQLASKIPAMLRSFTQSN